MGQGLPDRIVGTIDAPIGRHPSSGWKFAVVDGGKHAVTHYKLLEAFREASLLGVPRGGHVDANLVRAASFQVHLEQARLAEGL